MCIRDRRKPVLHRYLKAGHNVKGVSNVLSNQCTLDEALHELKDVYKRQVLRRHRIRRKRQHRWEKLWHRLLHNPIAPMVGETLYAIGFSAAYAVIRTGRRLQHGLQPVSYTHLDVYKRQGVRGGGRLGPPAR